MSFFYVRFAFIWSFFLQVKCPVCAYCNLGLFLALKWIVDLFGDYVGKNALYMTVEKRIVDICTNLSNLFLARS